MQFNGVELTQNSAGNWADPTTGKTYTNEYLNTHWDGGQTKVAGVDGPLDTTQADGSAITEFWQLPPGQQLAYQQQARKSSNAWVSGAPQDTGVWNTAPFTDRTYDAATQGSSQPVTGPSAAPVTPPPESNLVWFASQNRYVTPEYADSHKNIDPSGNIWNNTAPAGNTQAPTQTAQTPTQAPDYTKMASMQFLGGTVYQTSEGIWQNPDTGKMYATAYITHTLSRSGLMPDIKQPAAFGMPEPEVPFSFVENTVAKPALDLKQDASGNWYNANEPYVPDGVSSQTSNPLVHEFNGTMLYYNQTSKVWEDSTGKQYSPDYLNHLGTPSVAPAQTADKLFDGKPVTEAWQLRALEKGITTTAEYDRQFQPANPLPPPPVVDETQSSTYGMTDQQIQDYINNSGRLGVKPVDPNWINDTSSAQASYDKRIAQIELEAAAKLAADKAVLDFRNTLNAPTRPDTYGPDSPWAHTIQNPDGTYSGNNVYDPWEGKTPQQVVLDRATSFLTMTLGHAPSTTEINTYLNKFVQENNMSTTDPNFFTLLRDKLYGADPESIAAYEKMESELSAARTYAEQNGDRLRSLLAEMDPAWANWSNEQLVQSYIESGSSEADMLASFRSSASFMKSWSAGEYAPQTTKTYDQMLDHIADVKNQIGTLVDNPNYEAQMRVWLMSGWGVTGPGPAPQKKITFTQEMANSVIDGLSRQVNAAVIPAFMEFAMKPQFSGVTKEQFIDEAKRFAQASTTGNVIDSYTRLGTAMGYTEPFGFTWTSSGYVSNPQATTASYREAETAYFSALYDFYKANQQDVSKVNFKDLATMSRENVAIQKALAANRLDLLHRNKVAEYLANPSAYL